MRTLLVVIFAPVFDLLPRVSQARKPVGIQTFIAQPAVEAFHVRVLHRLSWLNELQPHSTFFAPRSQRSATKFRSIVEDDRFRKSTLLRHSIQHAAHA